MARLNLMDRNSPFSPDMVSRQKPKQPDTVRQLPKSVSGFLTRGSFVSRSSTQQMQKVAVYVVYKKAGFSDASKYRKSLRTNATYITRDDTITAVDEKGDRLSLADVHEKTHGWDDDHRYYRIVFSPEHGSQIDLEAFAADTMKRVGADLLTDEERNRGVVIEYVVVQHHDTDHPHVHVMMRAKVEDRELRISAGYFSHGMKGRAEEVATSMLGYRIDRDIDKEQQRDIDRALLEKRRSELGLDPVTGIPPATDPDAGQSTTKAKTKEQEMDRNELDGGIG